MLVKYLNRRKLKYTKNVLMVYYCMVPKIRNTQKQKKNCKHLWINPFWKYIDPIKYLTELWDRTNQAKITGTITKT